MSLLGLINKSDIHILIQISNNQVEEGMSEVPFQPFKQACDNLQGHVEEEGTLMNHDTFSLKHSRCLPGGPAPRPVFPAVLGLPAFLPVVSGPIFIQLGLSSLL